MTSTKLTCITAPILAIGAPAGGDTVTVWNANAGVAATTACISPGGDPFHESRIYAMLHVAIHDALNAIDRRSRPYALDLRAEARIAWSFPPGGEVAHCVLPVGVVDGDAAQAGGHIIERHRGRGQSRVRAAHAAE